MSIISAGGAVVGAGGPSQYQIERSLRFNSADTAYLDRTPASASNRKTWTWSGWVKRGASGDGTGSNHFFLFSANGGASNTQIDLFGNTIRFYLVGGTYLIATSQVFRDYSSWYHFVFVLDTTQATSSNRMKVYVNGTQVTSFSTANYPPQNTDGDVNNTVAHAIGKNVSTNYFSGYMTEINFIDGSALDPTSFGEYNEDTGVWQPKAYTGSYGTNGFYLNFSDNSGTTSTTLGKDQAGSNNWTPNNFSVTAGAGNDSLVDTPTNYGTDTGVGGEVRGNYATWNPVNVSGGGTTTITNGNLDCSAGSTTTFAKILGTFGISTGKWYWETTITAVGSLAIVGIGDGTPVNGSTGLGGAAGEISYLSNGNKYTNNTTTAYGATYTTNDIIGVAYDADVGSITFYKNGVSQGAITGFSGTKYPAVGSGGGTNPQYTANFGQRPFAYTAPSGFKALCTQNLPEPTIVDGGEYFNTVLYTGTGSSLGVTGVGFQPDWVWIKERSGAADHGLYDAVRGTTKQLESNTTTAETTEATGLTAFGTDGFTVGALAQLNTSSATYVAWNWKANGAGVSNTAGTITSTVSANTDSGFSIVTYTGNGTSGATFGHGLGLVPSFILVKARSSGAQTWRGYHKDVGATKTVNLAETSAAATDSSVWNNTAPSSTVVTVGNGGSTNGNGTTFVAYVFAAIPGYSAISSFTGNGSADGPFIFTNHRPAFVLIKRTDTTSNWTILDFQREGYNVDNDPLFPNLSNAEGTTDLADLLSNGFKLRTTDASVNASSGTYIYMSLATNPFKYSLAR